MAGKLSYFCCPQTPVVVSSFFIKNSSLIGRIGAPRKVKFERCWTVHHPNLTLRATILIIRQRKHVAYFFSCFCVSTLSYWSNFSLMVEKTWPKSQDFLVVNYLFGLGDLTRSIQAETNSPVQMNVFTCYCDSKIYPSTLKVSKKPVISRVMTRKRWHPIFPT